MVKNTLHNYEIMYIIDDKNEAKADAIKQELTAILIKDGGTVTKEENSIRQFAQTIDHKSRGHYFSLWVKTTPQNIADFNRIFLIRQRQGDVMRKMVINLDREPIYKFKEVKERPPAPNREFRPRRPINAGENPNRSNDERPKNYQGNRFKKDGAHQSSSDETTKKTESKA